MSGIVITSELYARIQQVALHPLAEGMTPESLIATMARNEIDDPELYIAILEMQLGMLQAVTTYAERYEKSITFDRVLRAVGASMGVVMGRLSARQPCVGKDVAQVLGQFIADSFAQAMAGWFAWIEPPPPPKQATHDAIPSLN